MDAALEKFACGRKVQMVRGNDGDGLNPRLQPPLTLGHLGEVAVDPVVGQPQIRS